LIENFGYRQLVSLWRIEGLMQWLFGIRPAWGDMKRSATWNKVD